MASATGIPQHVPNDDQEDTEPLLGRPGDATQADEAPIAKNLIIGMCYLSDFNLPAILSPLLVGLRGSSADRLYVQVIYTSVSG